MNTMLGIFNLGGGEVFLILAVVLILFGARKLPELAKGLGQGIKEFKKATREVSDEMHNAMEETPPPQKKIPAATVSNEPAQPAAPQTTTPSQKA
jgi:sec-independent protein translocase protein TatA